MVTENDHNNATAPSPAHCHHSADLFRFIFYGVLTAAIALFGVAGNGFAIRVLTKPSVRCPTAVILTALAVMDAVALACHLLISPVDAWAELLRWKWLNGAYYSYIVPVYALLHAAAFGGAYTALLAAFERVLSALCAGIGRRLRGTIGALVGVGLVALLSLAFNSHKLFQFAVRRYDDCAVGDWNAHLLHFTPFGRHVVFHPLFQLIRGVLSVLGPYFVMTGLVVLMAVGRLMGRRRASRRPAAAAAHYQSQQYGRMVAGIALLFLLLRLPHVILMLTEWTMGHWQHRHATLYRLASNAAHLSAVINCAAKPLVYAALSRMFRRELVNKREAHETPLADMRMDEKAAHSECQGGDAVNDTI